MSSIDLSFRKINSNFNFFLTQDGKVKTFEVTDSTPNYEKINNFVQDVLMETSKITKEQCSEFLNLISNDYSAKDYLEETDTDAASAITFEFGRVFFNGQEVNGSLASRILMYKEKGMKEVTSLIRFLENLMENPSYRVHEQLFNFLERGKTAFTPDGHFLAYKYVNPDFTSVHDGKTRNDVGTSPEMPRYKVNDDPDRACGEGLHCCSNEYLSGYASGNIILQVKVNPRDVVSVPKDHNATKMRCCKYYVMGVLSKEQVNSDYLASSPVIDPEATPKTDNKSSDVRYDKLGRPMPKRGPDGKFLKKGN